MDKSDLAFLLGQLFSEIEDVAVALDGEVAQVRMGGSEHSFRVEERGEFSASAASAEVAKAHQHHPGSPPVLLASPYVTEKAGRTLRAAGRCYADLAGNCFIRSGELLVLVEGQRRRAKPKLSMRAFRGAGVQIIFELLRDSRAASLPYRSLADRAGVSRGAVGYVLADLEELGFLEKGRGERRLTRRADLIDRWAVAFAEELRPKLARGRYAFESEDQRRAWQDVSVQDIGARWSGDAGADLLLGALKPQAFVLYASASRSEIVKATRLRPDPEGPVEVLDRFWQPTPGQDPPGSAHGGAAAHPLVVYADLLAGGDARSLGAARRIRSEMLLSGSYEETTE
jgi:hypothetical protein